MRPPHGEPPHALWTQEPPASHKRAVRCVQLAGILAVIGFFVFLVSLSVARGNGTVTGNATVFYLIGSLLFFVCTIASYFAVKHHNGDAAVAFTGITVVMMIVWFSFMVADLVSPECEQNVVYFLWCVPGEDQRALPLVIQDVIILCVLGLFAMAGLKLRKLNSTRKLEVLRANLTTVEDGDLGPIPLEEGVLGPDGLSTG